MIRDILHVDIDAFFASVEQVRNPALQGKPVVVGGLPGQRGVVASASYEARAYGLHAGMPLVTAQKKCPHALFFKGSFPLYKEINRKIRTILLCYSPAIEQVSIDEFFVDLSGCRRLHGPPLAAADSAKRAIREATGLSVSIGIGANKLVAKIASKLSKPNGIMEIGRGYESLFLSSLDLGRVPGIGRKTAEILETFNVRTVEELRGIPLPLLEQTFGQNGRALYHRARGQDDSPVAERDMPRSVSRETTFEEDTAERDFLEGMLHYLVERIGKRLREDELFGRTVRVKIRYADFREEARSVSLEEATHQDDALFASALDLFRKLYTRRVRLRLVGVAVSGLSRLGYHQEDLFTPSRFLKKEAFYHSLDRIRNRFGFSTVTVGRSLHLLSRLQRTPSGFLLKTPSLTR